MKSIKTAGRCLTAVALVGMFVFSTSATVEGGISDGQVYETYPNFKILSRVPELTALRESVETNEALREFLLDFINTYIVSLQSENRGERTWNLSAERQRLSDHFMAGYRQAMGADTASRALGLNENGKDLFYGSKDIDFFTTDNTIIGTFEGTSRIVSVAINTIHDGIIRSMNPEEIAATILYEIDGRGRGWSQILSYALLDHFGLPNKHRHGGLWWDPSMEVKVSRAAGGIHTLFEAGDNGASAVRDHMNENFRNANQFFNFDYDSWQMARRVDRILRHESRTPNGQMASQAFTSKIDGIDGNIISSLNQLQQNINLALDINLNLEDRRKAALEVNEIIAILTEIGILLDNISQATSTYDYRLPVVDIDNPEAGIAGMTGHLGMADFIDRPIHSASVPVSRFQLNCPKTRP